MAQIFAIGSNGSGQLGIGHKEDVSVPKPVQFDHDIPGEVTQVKAGGNHTIILSSGILYGSGNMATGALGLSPDVNSPQFHFRQLKLATEESTTNTAPVALCAASWDASIIVQKDGNGKATQVYSFGTGNKGELGQGELLFRSAKAQLLKDFPPAGLEIVDLTASVSHVVAVLDNGDVYGWGNGRKGQLGLPEGIVFIPRRIDALDFKVVRAVAGREFTYLVGDTLEGKHAILGSDKDGIRSSAPTSVTKWKDIGAGWGSITVLREDGSLLAWGKNELGQLAPPEIPRLSRIAVGSEHSLGLALDGDVLAWGWGEHGNCGPTRKNGDVDKWNIIASTKYLPPESKIYSIGAGCATSWICLNS